MIDTHSHIYLPDFIEDLDEVLERAESVGVTDILMPAIDFDSLKQMEQLSHNKIRFHKMAGLHPCDVSTLSNDFEEKLNALCQELAIIGVGETGLDYYWSKDHIREQHKSLHIHCRVAKDLDKPIVLHNRESTSDLLDIIEGEQDGSLRGIWHCFNGSVDEGKRALDLGLHLGIGGVVTFKNGGVDKTVTHLPLDKMVLETDAPYLTPTPNRGKRNEPAYMEFTAQKLADIFEMPLGDLVRTTSETARNLFRIN